MAIFECPHPGCGKRAEVPDQYVGKRVRCGRCGHDFVPGARPGHGAGIAIAPQPVKSVPPPVKTIPVVVASPRRGGYGWVLAAVGAFLLPVLAAGAFVGLRGGQKAPPGELYAGVEVGSSGVTYTVFEVFKQPDQGYDYRILLFESRTTNIHKGMEKKGTFDTDGLARTIDAVRECYEKLTEGDKIPPDRVFLVGSDGLMGAIRNRKDLSEGKKDRLISANQKTLGRAVKKAVGKTMTFLDPDEKAALEFEAVVEPGHLDTGLYVDIGTGATRGAYREPGGKIRRISLAGVGLFADRARSRRGPGLADELIRRPFRRKAENAPEFRQRPDVYLAGGIVWVLSTCLHPKEQVAAPETGLYVSLTAEDIDSFAADVRGGKDFLKTYRPPVGLSAEERQQVQKEIKRMHKPFPPEKLAAGAEILAALAAEMKLEGKNLRFHRYAHVAWLMAYIARYDGLKR
jgi:hypothetical protein